MSRPVDAIAPKKVDCNDCGKIRCSLFYRCQECLQASPEVKYDLCPDCEGSGKFCKANIAHVFKLMLRETFDVEISTPPEDLRVFVKSEIDKQMPIAPDQDFGVDFSSPENGAETLGLECSHDDTLLPRIIDVISENSGGRFLLAKQYVRSLGFKHNRRDIDETIKNIEEQLPANETDMIYQVCSSSICSSLVLDVSTFEEQIYFCSAFSKLG